MIHSDKLFEPNREICKSYFMYGLQDRKIFGYSPLKSGVKLLGRIFSKKQKAKEADGKIITDKTKGKAFSSRRTYQIMTRLLGDLEPLGRISISKKMEKWVMGFQPEVIYSPIASISYMRFVTEIQALTNASLAIHFMDDWPSASYRRGVLAPFFRRIMHKELRKILALADVRIGSGQAMCEEYQKRYGYDFLPFSNPEDSKLWEDVQRKDQHVEGEFKILYVGTINSKNIQSLVKISRVIQDLNSKGHNVVMRIYSFQPRADLYRPKFERGQCVKVEEVPKELRDFRSLLCNGNLLLIPLDFTKASIDRMRLSFFTKIPAYMVSGVPIMIYGPEEIAVVKEAKEEGWAYVVSNEKKEAIEEAVLSLMEDIELRMRISSRAKEIAVDRHGANKVRERFREVLHSISNRPVK